MGYYDDIADGYSELHGEEQKIKANILKAYLRVKPSDRLLDVGCGDGAYLDLFDCHVQGIDPSTELIKSHKGKHTLVHGFAESLPFKDNEFDIVISLTAIQNFTNLEKGLSEINRVGKDRFALTFLKRSAKHELISNLIHEKFNVIDVIEEDKDLIFFCRKR